MQAFRTRLARAFICHQKMLIALFRFRLIEPAPSTSSLYRMDVIETDDIDVIFVEIFNFARARKRGRRKERKRTRGGFHSVNCATASMVDRLDSQVSATQSPTTYIASRCFTVVLQNFPSTGGRCRKRVCQDNRESTRIRVAPRVPIGFGDSGIRNQRVFAQRAVRTGDLGNRRVKHTQRGE